MDYTDSEEGQYAIMQAEQDAKDQRDIETMLADYREVRGRMLVLTESLFPAGRRVAPIGCKQEKWRGTVRDLSKHKRRDLAADSVWIDWDNGNSHPVTIDEIEHVQ